MGAVRERKGERERERERERGGGGGGGGESREEERGATNAATYCIKLAKPAANTAESAPTLYHFMFRANLNGAANAAPSKRAETIVFPDQLRLVTSTAGSSMSGGPGKESVFTFE